MGKYNCLSERLNEEITAQEQANFIPQQDYIALREKVRGFCGYRYQEYIERFYLIPRGKIIPSKHL